MGWLEYDPKHEILTANCFIQDNMSTGSVAQFLSLA